MEDLPSGPIVLVARADGFAPYVGGTSAEGGLVRDVRVGMVPEQVVAGRVVGPGGAPLAGAGVKVRCAHGAAACCGASSAAVRPRTRLARFFLNGVVQNTPLSLRAETSDGKVSNVVTVTVG